MIHYDTSKNIYWTVGDEIFYNRLAALELSLKTDQEIKFYMFEDAFDACDWTKEPEESWEELLKQRAHQLRDTQEYIRLWYSGGTDSHTMLLAFLSNGIHIDEIVMRRDSPLDNFEDEQDIEINDSAIPFIDSIKNRIPNTKITILDFGSREYSMLYKHAKQYGHDAISPKPLMIQEIRKVMPAGYTVDENIKYCELYGVDKPKLDVENGRFCSLSHDGTFAFESAGNQDGEYFFITPDMPKLHIKQSHMAMNYIKKHHPEYKDIGMKALNEQYYNHKEFINNSCRYPLWKPVSLGKESNSGCFLSEKQVIIIKQMKQHRPEMYDGYMGIMSDIQVTMGEGFNDNDVFKGWIGVPSKKYFLEE